MQLVILGGGAAGFFAAITAKAFNPSASVILLEKTAQLLSKVKISGGGRCNVTHSCFDPKQLVKNYPRGFKELLGCFMRFQPQDTIEWFGSRGVETKVEEDGRMFPITDSSSTIIDCLLNEARRLKVEIRTGSDVENIEHIDGLFSISIKGKESLNANALLLATGSHPSGHRWATKFGHTIIETVPSLFTFNVPSSPFKELAGVSIETATLSLPGTSFSQSGPLLLTHWGFSGPAALKLSAWGARFLKEKSYQTPLCIDWLPLINQNALLQQLKTLRSQFSAQLIANNPVGKLPKSLWKLFLDLEGMNNKRLSDVSNDELASLAGRLKQSVFQVEGKTINKEEFVTCGGVTLQEINFKTMESRVCPGLYFAGEILDVDAVTGGFNFQNAWTTGWIAGQSMVQE